MPNFFKKKENKSISISSKLIEIVEELADRKGMTFSGFVEQALKDRVLHEQRDDCPLWHSLYQKIFG